MSSNCWIETTPIEIKFPNLVRARAQIVGLRRLYNNHKNCIPNWARV